MRDCSRRAPTGVRNRALIAACWRSGLRIGEALALAVKDLDPDSGTLVVQRGKGGKRRTASGWPLFCTLRGEPMDQSYVRHLLPRLERKAGIERRAHAHGLRHAFAVDMVRSGAALRRAGRARARERRDDAGVPEPRRRARSRRGDEEPRVARARSTYRATKLRETRSTGGASHHLNKRYEPSRISVLRSSVARAFGQRQAGKAERRDERARQRAQRTVSIR